MSRIYIFVKLSKILFLMRYFIEITYRGTAYNGWQSQPNGHTVQDVLEKAMSTVLRAEIKIMGAGRTDAGVHAKQLFAHFDSDKRLDEQGLCFRLNGFLPEDISIKSIREVKPDAHARFDAIGRTYEYHIIKAKDPFKTDLAYVLHHLPDIDKINTAAKILLDYKDFQCFSRSNTDVKTYHCKINSVSMVCKGETLVFTISADRFLRNMVRAIMGTLLEIGFDKISIEDFHKIIAGKNRNNAGASVPARGLYLTEVLYPKEIFI